MKLKDLYKKTLESVAEYRREIYVYIFVWIILLTIGLGISFLFGVHLLIVFFLVFPIQFSLNYIAKKVGDHLPLVEKEFYFGFKAMGGSLILGAKQNFKGFLKAFFIALGIILVGSAVVVVILLPAMEPAYYDQIVNAAMAGDFEAAYVTLNNIKWVSEAYLVIYGMAILEYILVFPLFTGKNTMAGFLCLSIPYSPDSAIEDSVKIANHDRKLFNKMNFVSSLFVVLACAIGFSFYYLTYGSIFVNEYACISLSCLLASLVLAPLDIFHQISKYHYFVNYGQGELRAAIDKINASIQAMHAKEENKDKNE